MEFASGVVAQWSADSAPCTPVPLTRFQTLLNTTNTIDFRREKKKHLEFILSMCKVFTVTEWRDITAIERDAYASPLVVQVDESPNGLFVSSQTAGMIMRSRFPRFPVETKPSKMNCDWQLFSVLKLVYDMVKRLQDSDIANETKAI